MGVRHNILREVLLHFCLLGGFQAEREVPGLLRGSGDRPADVLLSIANALGSKSCCLDIAVTHTQQISILSRASVEPGAAAAAYESKVKLRRYAAVCAANGLEFVPMVVDVFGAWGPLRGPFLAWCHVHWPLGAGTTATLRVSTCGSICLLLCSAPMQTHYYTCLILLCLICPTLPPCLPGPHLVLPLVSRVA